MKLEEEQEDRTQDLLKELLEVVRRNNPQSSTVSLRYIVDGIDIDITMTPIHGYTIGSRSMNRWGVSSER